VTLVVLAAPLGADAPGELERARHDLAISEQVLAVMTERVRLARADPGIAAAERQRLDQYLARVGQLVALNRERVAELSRAPAGQPGGAGAGAAGAAPASVTEAEQVAALEKRLGESLEAFDGILLEEARRARTRNADARSNAGGSGGGAGSGGSGGGAGAGAPDSGGSAGTEAGGGATTARGTGEQASEPPPAGRAAGGDDASATPVEGAGAGGPGNTAVSPPDIGDGSDDDVVARQIRKAAESETDPDLRKKLWEEYRKYKQGTKG
jgi:hypothetical protein